MAEKVLYNKCLKCGRVLKTPATQERGYGYVCWRKHLTEIDTRKPSFNLDLVKKEFMKNEK